MVRPWTAPAPKLKLIALQPIGQIWWNCYRWIVRTCKFKQYNFQFHECLNPAKTGYIVNHTYLSTVRRFISTISIEPYILSVPYLLNHTYYQYYTFLTIYIISTISFEPYKLLLSFFFTSCALPRRLSNCSMVSFVWLWFLIKMSSIRKLISIYFSGMHVSTWFFYNVVDSIYGKVGPLLC